MSWFRESWRNYWQPTLVLVASIAALIELRTLGMLIACFLLAGYAIFLFIRLEGLQTKFPFKIKKYDYELFLRPNGLATGTCNVHLQVLRGSVAAVGEFVSCWGDGTLNAQVIVGAQGNGGRVKANIREYQRDRTILKYLIVFSPPVRQQIVYTLTETTQTGAWMMTREDVDRQTGLPFPGFEAEYVFVTWPIDEIIFSVAFDSEYNISEPSFDVIVAESPTTVEEEKHRLIRTNAFNPSVIEADRRILRLRIKNPKTGLSYVIKWRPPPQVP